MTAPTASGALVAMLLVAGCADGLVYGERTSFNLASVRVNDDPAEPVVVKLGFDRDVVLVAPPLGGEVVDTVEHEDGTRSARTTARGEAVSQFSTFTLQSAAPFVDPTAAADLLAVRSRFASGQAAIAIASEPEVAAAFLGLVAGSEITAADVSPQATARREAIFDALGQIDGDAARRLAAQPPATIDRTFLSVVDPDNQRGTNEAVARRVLNGWVTSIPAADFAEWEAALGIRRS